MVRSSLGGGAFLSAAGTTADVRQVLGEESVAQRWAYVNSAHPNAGAVGDRKVTKRVVSPWRGLTVKILVQLTADGDWDLSRGFGRTAFI